MSQDKPQKSDSSGGPGPVHNDGTETSSKIYLRQGQTLHPSSQYTSPLLNDFYQITMVYAYWKHKRHNLHAVFDVFFRKNPFHGEYTVFAGLEEVIRHVSTFHFTDAEIEYLKEVLDCENEFFEYLRTLDCSQIKVYAIPEGTVVFPRLPLIIVEGPIAVCQLLETTILTLVNFPSLIVTNAVRHRLVAGKNKTLIEFGIRRAQGVDGGMTASRYSYMGGFDGTSNVAAGRTYGIPVKGTHAHSFVSSFVDENDISTTTIITPKGESVEFHELVKKASIELGFTDTNKGELTAFTAYAISFPTNFLALVDTYDTLKSGVPNFLSVSFALHQVGYKGIGIRLDSGDLSYLSLETRHLFQRIAKKTKIDYFEKFSITASNDLTENTMASLNVQGHEIDTFGIGTNLVTCQSQPALGCVYKLVSIEGKPRIKLSQEVDKVTIPTRKEIYRLYGKDESPVLDLLVQEGKTEDIPKKGQQVTCFHPFQTHRRCKVTPLRVESLLKLYWDGKVVEDLPSLDMIRSRVLAEVGQLRKDVVRGLNPTPYKVSVTQDLQTVLQELWYEMAPIPDIS
eukprot:TRINITY_DN7753_c0_g1_i1.p1 TRINITY_DN7753_c0_g1~~TRINITY_DN7753_c0_g1_i1.p1  ORF type:complete len:567 (-),score=80.16 TRINITY_DN7753_c0_g1_i1:31-1731(-)